MKNNKIKLFLYSSFVVLLVLIVIAVVENKIEKNHEYAENKVTEEATTADPFLLSENIRQELLTVNEYSRPGTKLSKVNAIVIHYVANPQTTAMQNRNYFESLKDTHERGASSHFIIGLDGEIIQCVPLDEISYASNDRNEDTIAIENCHPDETGQFNEYTYSSLVTLTAALCNTYGLNPETDVIRHYDITGKLCPLYFVSNEEEWTGFKADIKNAMEKE